jgi:hypothetical protein
LREDIVTLFNNILSRKFSDAAKTLAVLEKKKFRNSEFKEGYLVALKGLYISMRSGDERDFINRAGFDLKTMEGYKKEFRSITRNEIQSPFDVGYFSAWSDFIQFRINEEK